jgi:hypothetical protein
MALALVAAPCAAQEPPEFEADEPIAILEPIPDLLTIEDALRLAGTDHPSIAQAAAQGMLAQSQLEAAQSRYQVNTFLDLDARTADKAVSPGTDFVNDSRVSLYLSRLLTDFGGSRAAAEAATERLEGANLVVDYRRSLNQLGILQSFLDVHLADLRYFVDDEDMTLAFLRYDRLRDRRDRFEEFAEVDELELETNFRERLATRERAANQRRNARNRLALAMARPGELTTRVIMPDLAAYDRPLPEYGEVLEEVLDAHPLLKVNRLMRDAAEQTVRENEFSSRPELMAQIEATEWNLDTGNRDRYVAGLRLRVPLGGTQVRDAKVAEAVAEKYRIEAEHKALEFELRQQVLDMVQSLSALHFDAQAADVNERFRDLYLDRSRTLYQLEVRTDLGDSQARQAEALWRSTRIKFERAMIWAKLDAMRGLPLALLQAEERQ